MNNKYIFKIIIGMLSDDFNFVILLSTILILIALISRIVNIIIAWIKIPDLNINTNEFILARFHDFCKVQQAFTKYDVKTIEQYTSQEISNNLKEKIKEYKKQNKRNIMDFFTYKDGYIEDIITEENKITIVVVLEIEMIDYILQNKKLISGNKYFKTHKKYRFEFSKDKKNKQSNWILSKNGEVQ